jgi:hypothetical protein
VVRIAPENMRTWLEGIDEYTHWFILVNVSSLLLLMSWWWPRPWPAACPGQLARMDDIGTKCDVRRQSRGRTVPSAPVRRWENSMLVE